VVDSLHFLDELVYDLDAFTIMSNHVHVLFSPLEKEEGGYHALPSIMHSLKRFTARKANKLLKREGAFWQQESYDHVVRDQQEWERIVAYILNNPVKAGLVASWDDWPWSYLK
jgi:putative transposase